MKKLNYESIEIVERERERESYSLIDNNIKNIKRVKNSITRPVSKIDTG